MTVARDLDGRLAIVTGASSGIGRSVAMLLARRGARVVAVGRNRARLEELAALQDGIVPQIADLADPGSTDLVFDAASRLGAATILVCAAGLPGFTDRPIASQSFEAWRATMAVNLDSPFLMTRAIAPLIGAAQWGRIVYVSSTAGQVGAPSMSAYCASKHGLIGLMRSVACDIGVHGATANAVCPGWVRTGMAENDALWEAEQKGVSPEEIWRLRDASYPRGRVLTADEVAQTISFLASDSAAGINGEAVTVALGGLW
jgi:NAD(P)-dependent dehydrogenase (short-subunit alcohol dehydrogenase family)